MKIHAALCALCVNTALSSVTSAQSRVIDLEGLNESISSIERLCLSNHTAEGSLSATAGGLWDTLKKAVNAQLGIGGSVTTVRGPVGEFTEEFRKEESDSIRACLEQYVTRWETAILNEQQIVDKIILMDGDHISYERDACSTDDCRREARSNRVVLRDELNGELGTENIDIEEYGIFPRWNSPADVEAKQPSLVIVHWSGFESAGSNESQSLSCDPVENNRCSELIVENLAKINSRSEGDPRFIIYSRNRWICGDEFRDGLISRIPADNTLLASKIGLISINEAYERDRVLTNRYAVADMRDMSSFFLGVPSTFKHDPENGICILSRAFD